VANFDWYCRYIFIEKSIILIVLKALLKLNLRNICIILSVLFITCAGFLAYRGRFVAIMLIPSPEKELFDVDVEIPLRYKEVSPGEEILVQLSLYNIQRIGRVDVEVEYGIEDMEGNEIVSEYTTMAIEFQVSVIRSLDVPSDTRSGNYVLFARARYGDVVGTGSSLFRVITKEALEVGKIRIFSLTMTIFVFLFIVMILSLYKRVMKINVRTVKH
jgi:hypothetical protein